MILGAAEGLVKLRQRTMMYSTVATAASFMPSKTAGISGLRVWAFCSTWTFMMKPLILLIKLRYCFFFIIFFRQLYLGKKSYTFLVVSLVLKKDCINGDPYPVTLTK